MTEEVGRITFTGDGETGVIRPGQFQDFGLSVAVPEGRPGKKLTFKALQTYSNGEVVRWIGPPDSEEPAPQVELTAAEEQEAVAPAAEAPPAPAAEEDVDGTGSRSRRSCPRSPRWRPDLRRCSRVAGRGSGPRRAERCATPSG